MNSDFFASELFTWLSRILRTNEFDYVVCVERKATAVLRMYLDYPYQHETELQWDRVLSSDALAYLPLDYLNGKKLLIFNETVHLGSSTIKTVQKIFENSPGVKQIAAAAFACYHGFSSEHWRKSLASLREGLDIPQYFAYDNVSGITYEILWRRIVEMLRRAGALLLDTEHIETSFKLQLPIRKLIEALCDIGIPVEYESDDIEYQTGITIENPVIENVERIRSLLPRDTDLSTREPRKLRLVRRGPSEYAFISIWYPALPLDTVEEYISSSVAPDYIRPAIAKCPQQNRVELIFHLASLVSGTELLRSLWAGLAPLTKKGGVIPDILTGSLKPGTQLGHLRAMYPLLEFDTLESEIRGVVSASRNLDAAKVLQKARETQKSRKGYHPEFVDAKTRLEMSREILVNTLKKSIHFGIEEEWLDEDDKPPEEYPFTWDDFWQSGERSGIEENVRSVAMDCAIDSAILKTTHREVERNGRKFLVRGYLPDSEFARQQLILLVHGGESLSFDE
jgi:hypothetical protein